MNYQQILAISYVFNLMNILINNPNQLVKLVFLKNINYFLETIKFI